MGQEMDDLAALTPPIPEMQCKILRAVNTSIINRDDIAGLIAEALTKKDRHSIDWRKVNGAIIKRWSPKTLEYIQKKVGKKGKD